MVIYSWRQYNNIPVTYLLKKIKIFDLCQTGSFSVNDHFQTSFYYVEKLNGILRKNVGSGLKNFICPYMGAGGVKNCQNHPYVIK